MLLYLYISAIGYRIRQSAQNFSTATTIGEASNIKCSSWIQNFCTGTLGFVSVLIAYVSLLRSIVKNNSHAIVVGFFAGCAQVVVTLYQLRFVSLFVVK